MKVLYEGRDIYPEISVNACFHDLYAEKQSDTLLLRLNDTRQLWDVWNPQADDEIAIENGAAKTGKLFIESIRPESGLLTLRAYSVPQSVKARRNKSWERVKLLQLAQEISDRHGLRLETYGVTDQQYGYVSQNNAPDFAFLQQRCTLEGLAFLVYDGKLVLYDAAYLENQAPRKTFDITPASVFEYRDDALNAYGSAELANGRYTGRFTASTGEILRKVVSMQLTSQAEADRFAKGLLRDANRGRTTGTLWTSLQPEFAAGSVATLRTEGVHSWDGAAFLWRIRHDYVHNRSKLFFRKPLEGY